MLPLPRRCFRLWCGVMKEDSQAGPRAARPGPGSSSAWCHAYLPDGGPHLLLIESSLDRRPVLHLLGEPAVSGASQMLLLHGGPNAHRCGLLVLQHVSEASDVGGKRRRSKEGDGKRGGGSRVPHQLIARHGCSTLARQSPDIQHPRSLSITKTHS